MFTHLCLILQSIFDKCFPVLCTLTSGFLCLTINFTQPKFFSPSVENCFGVQYVIKKNVPLHLKFIRSSYIDACTTTTQSWANKNKKYLFYWIAFEKKFNLLMHSGTFKVQKKPWILQLFKDVYVYLNKMLNKWEIGISIILIMVYLP